MTERIDLLLTHLQLGGDGRARIETEVFGTRQYSVEIDDGRTVVRFVEIRTGRPVTLVAARGPVTLEDARQQQDALHITTIAVISDKGEIIPIVKRPLEAGATPTRSDVVPFARLHGRGSLRSRTSWTSRRRISWRTEDGATERGEAMKDPNIVFSGHCGQYSRDGISVEVSIARLEHEAAWTLEVVNANRTSIVWDDQFPSDDAAYAEFLATVEDEGMQVFLDDGNVVPFKRP